MSDHRHTSLVVALLTAALVAGGCASSDSTPSGSAASGDPKNRDTLDCMNIAREVRASPQGPRTTVDQDRYQQCMRERGHMGAPTK